jgi:hypothetical protein
MQNTIFCKQNLFLGEAAVEEAWLVVVALLA